MTSLYSSTFYNAHNIEVLTNMFYLILHGILTVYNIVVFSKEGEYYLKFNGSVYYGQVLITGRTKSVSLSEFEG